MKMVIDTNGKGINLSNKGFLLFCKYKYNQTGYLYDFITHRKLPNDSPNISFCVRKDYGDSLPNYNNFKNMIVDDTCFSETDKDLIKTVEKLGNKLSSAKGANVRLINF